MPPRGHVLCVMCIVMNISISVSVLSGVTDAEP